MKSTKRKGSVKHVIKSAIRIESFKKTIHKFLNKKNLKKSVKFISFICLVSLVILISSDLKMRSKEVANQELIMNALHINILDNSKPVSINAYHQDLRADLHDGA